MNQQNYKHICKDCKKGFPKAFYLKRHQERKFPCVKKETEIKHPEQINLSDSNKTSCPYCNNIYIKRAINKHYRTTCKLIPESKRKFFIDKYKKDERHIKTNLKKEKKKKEEEKKIELEIENEEKENKSKTANNIEITNVDDCTEEELNIKRTSIPKAVKDVLWKREYGKSGVGKCFVCSEEITSRKFDCGHIKAVCKGGTNNINNLKPICSTCNGSMGSMNMKVFKKMYFDPTLPEKDEN